MENEMKAGRELDALIAERVMGYLPANRGWQFFHEGLVETSYGAVIESDLYSTSIVPAWEVLVRLINPHISREAGVWLVQCNARNKPPYEGWKNVYARADTAPLAICRAALATVEDV